MPSINFNNTLIKTGSLLIIKLPLSDSRQLPSRGMVMVKGTVNGTAFEMPLEPDGHGSHFLSLDEALLAKTRLKAGDTVTLSMEPSKEWPEPTVPADLQKALNNDKAAHAVWQDITPMARWDWIRWVRATKDPTTRQRRVEVMCSKLTSGKRRPCCFDRTRCTIPEISRSGALKVNS